MLALATRNCSWCGTEFEPKTQTQLYCHPAHTKAANNAKQRKTPLPTTSVDGKPLDPKAAILALEKQGYVVTRPQPTEPVHELDLPRIKGTDRVRIGVVSDTHLCSTFQQLTALRDFYKYAEQEAKVSVFLHCGDVSDGAHQMHRDAAYHMFKHGFDAQRDYIADVYPESKVGTKMIGGNHDVSHINQNGADIIEAICSKRDDLEYLGDQISAYVDIHGVKILMQHPYMGSAYAMSYRLQKNIEAMQPHNKPHILLMGNFHKWCVLPYYRNVVSIQMASFVDQTPFMRSKSLDSVVGGLILEFGTDPAGIAGSVKFEFVNFPQPIPNDY